MVRNLKLSSGRGIPGAFFDAFGVAERDFAGPLVKFAAPWYDRLTSRISLFKKRARCHVNTGLPRFYRNTILRWPRLCRSMRRRRRHGQSHTLTCRKPICDHHYVRRIVTTEMRGAARPALRI